MRAALAADVTCRRHCISGWMRSPKISVPLTNSSKVKPDSGQSWNGGDLVEQACAGRVRADDQADIEVHRRLRVGHVADIGVPTRLGGRRHPCWVSQRSASRSAPSL